MNRNFHIVVLDDFPRVAQNVAEAIYKTMDKVRFDEYFNVNVYPCYTYEQAVYLLAKLPTIDLFITDYIILPKPMIVDRLKREASLLGEAIREIRPIAGNKEWIDLRKKRLSQIPEDIKLVETIKPIDIPNADYLHDLMESTQLEAEIIASAELTGILTTKLLINYTLAKLIPTVVLSGDSFEARMIKEELQIEIEDHQKGIGIHRFIFTNKLNLNINPSMLEHSFGFDQILLKAIERKAFRELNLVYGNPYEDIPESKGLVRYIDEVRAFNSDNNPIDGDSSLSSNITQ